MVSALISRVVILFFGTLYPAYASYKAIKTKNVREYVKWMMYWIVFALFCSIETFTDVLLSWLPFYYEVKIVFVVWLLSPITRGSSYLYKKFVHPQLAKREKEIDECIAEYSKKGYSTLLHLGSRGLTYATNVVLKTAIKGQSTLVDHIRKSYSTNDLRVHDTVDGDGERHSMLLDSDEDLVPDENSKETTQEKENDARLEEDNREIERRKPLRRSNSDATGLRPASSRYRSPVTDLSSVEEVEEETQSKEERAYAESSYFAYRKSKTDPYGTLPRTRSRTRYK